MAGYETCYLTQYLQYLSPISVAIKLNTKRFKILNMGAKNHFFFFSHGEKDFPDPKLTGPIFIRYILIGSI